MSRPRTLVLRAAGSNCDRETGRAFELAGAFAELVHVNRLVDGSKKLANYQILAVPGGFTYGDDVAAGKVLAIELVQHLGDALAEFVGRGGLVIGICNGFQVLVKTGLLPGAEYGSGADRAAAATLTFNDSQKFEDRWVTLLPGGRSVWTEGLFTPIRLPVAHGEGKFVARTEEILERMEGAGQVAFRYLGADVAPADGAYPANPNGSARDIAGVTDSTGRILGLMPHPERYVHSWQGPSWTREPEKREGDGLAIFRAAVKSLA